MKLHRHLTTRELARTFGVLPESVRSRFYRKGHYFGLVPMRLPNGRLLWSADAVERLLGKGG